jgi:exonuclease SbcD
VHADAVHARVRAVLTDQHLPNQAMARLRGRFPHAVELRHEPPGAKERNAAGIVGAGELRRLDPLDLALRFWADQEGVTATEAEADLLARALADAVEEPA